MRVIDNLLGACTFVPPTGELVALGLREADIERAIAGALPRDTIDEGSAAGDFAFGDTYLGIWGEIDDGIVAILDLQYLDKATVAQREAAVGALVRLGALGLQLSTDRARYVLDERIVRGLMRLG